MKTCPEEHPAPHPTDINKLSGIEFENIVTHLQCRMGFQVKETKRSGDGGVDILAKSTEPITGGLFIIQCKRYSSNVGEPVIRDLYGALNHLRASKAILITTSNFTRQARAFAEDKPIELIGGGKLKELLDVYKILKEIPGEKGSALICSSHKRFFEGLLRIANKIITTIEVDSILSEYGSKDYTLSDFIEIATVKQEYSSRYMSIIDVVTGISSRDGDNLTEIDVEYRLKVIDDIISEMLRAIHIIINARVDSDLIKLKKASINLHSAFLKDFVCFVKEVHAKLIETEGTLIDKGHIIDITLKTEMMDMYSAQYIDEMNQVIEKVKSLYFE